MSSKKKVNNKKILILNWRDPKHPLAGGAEISMLEHAKYWKEKGADITWVASFFKGAKNEETVDGVTYIRKGSHFSVHVLFFISYILHPKSYLHDIVIDCFHFIPFLTPLYMRNKKIIAWINEPAKEAWFKNIFFPLSLIGYFLEPLFFIPYRNIQFITSANSIKEELLKLGIKKIEIVPHGISIIYPEGVKKEKEPTLIYLAQISPDKGIEDAIEALRLLSSELSNVKLWVVGKASTENYLKKVKNIVNRKKLRDKVEFFGYVTEQKKFDLLKRALVLIHPSVREGWGLNVIEANGVGTPAVGYNVTGLRDSIVDGKTGILVHNTPDDIAKGAAALLNHKKKYTYLSKNAIKWSGNFSWEKSGEKSWNEIKKV